MRKVVIRNINSPEAQPLIANYCSSFSCQLRGLTFRRQLGSKEGLLLVQRRDSRLEAAIHMLGMLMDLAVIWINTNMQVVDLRLAKRWRPLYIPKFPARYVLETTPERLQDFKIGDEIQFDESL
jgi:uncharacterized membrane protein (UPF0127 family)